MSRAALFLCALLLAAAAVAALRPGPGSFSLIYQPPSSWTATYLHYSADGGSSWNPIPGVALRCPMPSPYTNYSCGGDGSWLYVDVGANTVVFVTTDGNGQWDNNDGRNYVVHAPGVYSLDQKHNLVTLQVFPFGCPSGSDNETCSGHGTCNDVTGQCACDPSWYGSACSRQCTCPTSAHASCDGQGICVCDSGWANCSLPVEVAGCPVDVANNVTSCGGCGHSCLAPPHVRTAVCSSGNCQQTCEPGYEPCSDGSCQDECPLPGCTTFVKNHCSGNNITTNPKFAAHDWQTPRRGDVNYRPNYQSYSDLRGYVRVTYDDSRLLSATARVVAFTRDDFATGKLQCSFLPYVPFQDPPPPQWGPSCELSASRATVVTPISVRVRYEDLTGTVHQLLLDPVDFRWNAPAVVPGAAGGDYRGGQKGAIIEFFGWRHEDIENECRFAAAAGYAGVKFFPTQEQVMSTQPFNNVMNPWYFMYQPVSYRLQGRMGNRDELRRAIQTCRSLGVRTYADAVTNHMVGSGNDANDRHRYGNQGWCDQWGMKNTSAQFPPPANSSDNAINGSSPCYTQGFVYEPNPNTLKSPTQEFPAVPYGPLDFHCERPLNSWNDPLDLNAGWLTGLVDLNTETDYVQQRIADYITDLLSIGFSGIRLDAAKHIQPPDLGRIFGKVAANFGGSLPSDFVAWLEVLLGGEANMLLCDPNSGYSYSAGLVNALASNNLSATDIAKIKIWYSAYPKETGVDCGMVAMDRLAIQNDDADQQNPGSTSRDMGSDGTVLVIDKDIPLHKHFEKKLFRTPNGASDNDNDYPIRMVLSSYWLPADSQDYGVPDGNSNCDTCRVTCHTCDAQQSMNFTAAYRAGALAYDTEGRFTRVHRDQGIVDAMRSWMHLPPMSEEQHKRLTRL